jgi:hypothetical protein
MAAAFVCFVGRPSILLAQRAKIGDFTMAPVFATLLNSTMTEMPVIPLNCDMGESLQPHQPERFVKVDMETALKARAEEKAGLARLKQSHS